MKLSKKIGRYCAICIGLLLCISTELPAAIPGSPTLRVWCSIALVPSGVPVPRAEQDKTKVLLQEKYQPGDQYFVETTSSLHGVLEVPADTAKPGAPKALRKTGTAKTRYLERVLAVDGNQLAVKTLRQYQQLEAQQKIGEDLVSSQLRGQVKQIVLIRGGQQDVTFSPDGPMLLDEVEQVRTDTFLARINGILPSQPVGKDDTWAVTAAAVQELTDLRSIHSGQLDCQLSKVESNETGQTAIVHFRGKIKGTGQFGVNEQTIQGSYHFDMKAQRLVSLQFEVTSVMFDKNQRKAGDTTASYRLVRQMNTNPQLNAAGLALDPNEENTLLLVQEPRLGLELVHSRRWVPRPISDKQWIIDGPSGSGLTIQFESSANIPDADRVRKEIEARLAKTAQGLKPEPDPAGWSHEGRAAQRLAWRGTQNGKDFVFEYFLCKEGQKGAIIAARYHAPEADEAQRDVVRMVQSLKMERK